MTGSGIALLGVPSVSLSIHGVCLEHSPLSLRVSGVMGCAVFLAGLGHGVALLGILSVSLAFPAFCL